MNCNNLHCENAAFLAVTNSVFSEILGLDTLSSEGETTTTDVDGYGIDGSGGRGGPINQASFLKVVIKALDNAEFDPKYAEKWIKSKNKDICQANFVRNVDSFTNASYVTVASSQLGKTNSFLYLIFKAGVMEGMPSILMTQNSSGEPTRFGASIDKMNALLKAHGDDVKQKNPQFVDMQVQYAVLFSHRLIVLSGHLRSR